jgi:hypothetical protein
MIFAAAIRVIEWFENFYQNNGWDKKKMLRKIKHLVLLILCICLLDRGMPRASAQSSGQLLAESGGESLKKSDVDQVIAFFEWAFETKFTDEQRNEYQSIKAESFRKDPAAEKKGINMILTTFAALRAKNENQQAKVRQAFNNDFIAQLRRDKSAEAVFLASVYDGAQGAAGNQTNEANGVGDISAIVGKWVWGRTGSSTISTVGTYMGSNGSRYTYQFFPGGRVEYTGIMNVMQGGCNQQVFRSVKGQASLSGNELTIRWEPEKFTRDFSCDTANNYTKTMPAKTEKLRIRFRNDAGQKQLCISDSECFSPTN